MTELMLTFDLLENTKKITNTLSCEMMGSLLCMLAEEWCKANEVSVVEWFEHLTQVVKEVNDEMGAYVDMDV